MKTAKRIIEERRKRNLTQAKLADLTGIAQPQIARYEKGQPPSQKNLAILCKVFELEPKDLINISSNEKTKGIEFDESTFNNKLKEVRLLSVDKKIAIEKMIDLAFEAEKVNRFMKEWALK